MNFLIHNMMAMAPDLIIVSRPDAPYEWTSSDDFRLLDLSSSDPGMVSGLAQHRREIEHDLDIRLAKDALVFKLDPGDKVMMSLPVSCFIIPSKTKMGV